MELTWAKIWKKPESIRPHKIKIQSLKQGVGLTNNISTGVLGYSLYAYQRYNQQGYQSR